MDTEKLKQLATSGVVPLALAAVALIVSLVLVAIPVRFCYFSWIAV
jgi:hypothetical protein